MGKLDGKVAVITGSGRGIGRGDALVLAKEGASVVVSDIDPEPINEVVNTIKAAGGNATGCVCDVRDPKQVDNLMDTAVNTFGDLNILVNNAGVTRDAMIVKMTDDQWNLVMDIHLKGAFNCIRSAGRYMAKEGHGGKIVNVSSVAGLMGNVGQINYSSAKGGLIAMAKAVAKEWARYGINCNAIAYGFVLTRMTDEKETGEMVFGEAYGIPKKVRDAFMQQIGGNVMTPEQAAQPVLYLVSPESDFVTGQVLNASAGMYI